MFSSTRGLEGLDPMTERDLADWLRSREPRSIPPSLWLRAYADLREAAAHPAPRMPRLAGSIGALASLAATVLILVAVAGVFVATGMPHTGIAAEPVVPPIPQPPDNGTESQFPWGLLALALCVPAAALPVLSRRIRGSAWRLVWGANPTVPPAPLRWLRSPRSAPRYLWLLGLFAVAGGVLSALSLMSLLFDQYPIQGWELALWSLASIATIVLPVVVAWRYPWSHRSFKWLVAGLGMPLTYGVITGVVYRIGLPLPYPQWVAVDSVIALTSAAAVAVGIAGMAGLTPSPSVRATAALTVLAFVPAGELLAWSNGPEYLFYAASAWAITASWLAIAYVAFAAVRSRPTLPWALLAVAASLYVVQRIGGAALWSLMNFTAPQTLPLDDAWAALSFAFEIARNLYQTLFLLALAIGLRPVFFGGNAETAEEDAEPVSAAEPD